MNEEKETIMDDAIARYMQKDIMLEKCAWAIAHLSRKEQTNAVQHAISELAEMRINSRPLKTVAGRANPNFKIFS